MQHNTIYIGAAVGMYKFVHKTRFTDEDQLDKYNDVAPLIQPHEHIIRRWVHKKNEMTKDQKYHHQQLVHMNRSDDDTMIELLDRE